MSLMDNVRRISVEDYPAESQETVDRLAEVLNFFMENTVETVNGQISAVNMTREFIEFEVTVDANGVPINNNRFVSEVGVFGTDVKRLDNLTNPSAFPTGKPFITFAPLGDGSYEIRHITNLTANTRYRLLIEVVYG